VTEVRKPSAGIDRRTSPRLPVDRSVGVYMGRNFQGAQLLDLSGGGALLESNEIRKANGCIGITLTVGNVTKTVTAVILRSHLENGYFRVACQFKYLSADEKAHLAAYLTECATQVSSETPLPSFSMPDECSLLVPLPRLD
jgi:PilZ domain